MRFIHDPTLQTLGIKSKVYDFLKTMEWRKFSKLRFPVDRDAVCEFLVSVAYVDPEDIHRLTLSFRVNGVEHMVGAEKMRSWFGFSCEGMHQNNHEINTRTVWESLSGSPDFDAQNSHGKIIKDGAVLYLHKYLAYSMFARVEASKVQAKDLLVLDAILQGQKLRTYSFVFESLLRNASSKSLEIGGANLITAIVYAASGRAFDTPGYKYPYLDYAALSKAHVVSTSGTKCFLTHEVRCGTKDGAGPLSSRSRGNTDPEKEESEEDDEEVEGWKQVLTRLDGVDANNAVLLQRVDEFDTSIQRCATEIQTLTKEHASTRRRMLSCFRRNNMEFSPSPPGSPTNP
ncbi:hypothetical protein M5689_011603 [Euphorbia peplus]|nr:hypothetical protein M5689_011603 [Euphorbia peplus]